ncbi:MULTISPECIES: hypothetical protein [Bacillus]|uniref:Uncharacterized protein n=1 Tax=Bacillus mycoides TaxID=1405 RepID=A0A1S9T2I5_BACMY|nr:MULTISPECIES: hypothetical protein [Bacillus]MDI6531429.1 hypothetical protein [Bacillus mycoides]OOR03861.1 hypothetical protein BW900_25060 [Bacillus mycoides]RAN71642.1 hypothetical protein B5P40_07850 [Bacillus sp. SRB_8]WJE59467.1 hypothetical protein QRE64_05475 [Bacillus mycoides]WJE65401.1 hypothetical protein QRE63_05705 [Bacillus mycoides]
MFHKLHVKDGKKLRGAKEAMIKEFVDNDPKCQFIVQQAELNKEFKERSWICGGIYDEKLLSFKT